MDRSGKRRIGAGALSLAGVFLGREFLVWAYGKILDAFCGLFTGESPKVMVATSFPWLDTLGIILMIAGTYFLVPATGAPRMEYRLFEWCRMM